MHGITSTSLSLLWNGNKLDGFKPVRGLWQGDPLSPYLFVLCMEYFGMMIQWEVEEGTWKPIHLTRHGLKLSYIFFCN
uniref:Reverse transcriptase domain-containing protein n=1 Tax=Cajanus cajan TaxID=3821 RepID=A0A151S978_CAJCA|nr:hypothetical protein KK1_026773 [Cajanus cajan]